MANAFELLEALNNLEMFCKENNLTYCVGKCITKQKEVLAPPIPVIWPIINQDWINTSVKLPTPCRIVYSSLIDCCPIRQYTHERKLIDVASGKEVSPPKYWAYVPFPNPPQICSGGNKTISVTGG